MNSVVTLTVKLSNGEVALDAKERQSWVSRLRAVVQRQGEVLSLVGIEFSGNL